MTIRIKGIKINRKNRENTKVNIIFVIVLCLIPLQFLITPFLQNILDSQIKIAIAQYDLQSGDISNVVAMENYLEIEVLDKSRCGGGGGNASVGTVKLPEGWCLTKESNMPLYVGHEPKNTTTRSKRSFVRHYNHNGYERCLANKTVVFIGDSRVRYQFMYLVSYLSTKRHMKCKDSFPSIKKEDVECEMIMREFNRRRQGVINWNSWYN